MKSKLLIFLALFAACSTTTFAQATATQNVTTTLTEVRKITVAGGAIAIPIKRSSDGLTQYINSAATMVVEHDLLINQKIIAFATLTGAIGNWQNRFLWVGTSNNAADAYWNALGQIATFPLVVNGGAQGPGSFIGNLPITAVGGTGPLTLNYAGGAGLAAIPGDASVDVTYNITDQ